MMAETVNILVQPTPNPNALKFVLEKNVKTSGKASYSHVNQTEENPLARALFTIRGVDQLHFYDNVITVTKFGYEDWDELESQIIDCLKDRLPNHNPDFVAPDPEGDRRKNLSPDLQAIEDILDRTVRPSLQGDGGDLKCLTYENDVLLIKYVGACGSCPSSLTGTLQAITSILRDEFNPEIEVYSVPE